MTVTPSFTMSGSIGAGTARHRLDGVATHLDVEADADRAAIGAMVALAEEMCFVLEAIQHAHPVHRTTVVNGKEVTPD